MEIYSYTHTCFKKLHLTKNLEYTKANLDYFRCMQLTEVTNTATAKDFITVNVLMNKSNPNYIRPLDNEVNDVFDPSKNKSFKYGEAKRWILKDDTGKLIGRIAAFTNSKYINKGTDFPTGGIGFFDSIDDQTAAHKLFDAAKEWLQSKGMEAMDG